MEYCASDCYIGFGTIISQRATVIGARVYIGPQCNIGACRIGDDTLIASGVHVMSGTRQHGITDLQLPIREQEGIYRQIVVGRDCWIGNAAIIMANVGDKSIVGAGSVVTAEIDALKIAVGNPARVIRERDVDIPARAKSPSLKSSAAEIRAD
ncbi:MAG: acyltransferase [Pseudomonadota bacterium]